MDRVFHPIMWQTCIWVICKRKQHLYLLFIARCSLHTRTL